MPTLADPPSEAVEALYFEGFGYPATSVYQEKVASPPDRETPHPADPTGEPWTEDETILEVRFPRLWEKYGESPGPQAFQKAAAS